MSRSALQWRHSLLIATVAFFAACTDDAPLAPNWKGSAREQLTAPVPVAPSGAIPAPAAPLETRRAADLGVCHNLQVPDGHKLASRLYASGVQIYHWNGTSWSFVAPSALLSADAGFKGAVGTHYAGPTWESLSGSKVVGEVRERCTPDASAIAWLLLRAVSSEGPGIFQRVTFIQRVNTVGGLAPSAPGNFTGEEARVPYTTEYLFYRAH